VLVEAADDLQFFHLGCFDLLVAEEESEHCPDSGEQNEAQGQGDD
jgi:hypothetical protein